MENIYDFTSRVTLKQFQFIAKSNPELNAILTGAKTEIWFTNMDESSLKLNFIYINYKADFKGFALNVRFKQPNFYALIMEFVFWICDDFDIVQPEKFYNMLLSQLRICLEFKQFQTISGFSFEKLIERYGDSNSSLIVGQKLEIIPFIDPRLFYSSLLNVDLKRDLVQDTRYIYLMLNLRNGLFKIGKSKTPYKREKTLHSEEPEILLLFVEPESELNSESKLHTFFKEKRVRGEWFKLTINDLMNFKKLIG